MAAVEGGTRVTMSLSHLRDAMFSVFNTGGGHIPGPGIKWFRLEKNQTHIHHTHTYILYTHTHIGILRAMGEYSVLFTNYTMQNYDTYMYVCTIHLYLLCDNVSVFSA